MIRLTTNSVFSKDFELSFLEMLYVAFKQGVCATTLSLLFAHVIWREKS